ncbi:MAG: BACON domain-containing protein [Bacteroidaceae bacterium]|nr:BACON domain-containing protein [Bacteroidaceae bacterium]
MMKKFKFLALAFSCLLAGTMFNSCSDDDPVVPTTFTVAPDAGTDIEATGGSLNVTVSSNANWTAASDAEWLTVSPTSGNGNATLTVTATENTDYESRTAHVKFNFNGETASGSTDLTFTQAGKEKPAAPTYHFDLLASVGATTGMSSTGVTSYLIRSVEPGDLVNPNYSINYTGIGADIKSAELESEAVIYKGYYYEVAPKGNSWYGKYLINNEGATTIARFEMGSSVFQTRKYAHAIIAENEFVFIGSDKASSKGSQNNIVWSKVKDNGTSFTLEGEGVLDLTSATKDLKEGGIVAFSTSGLAKYRPSDNTIIYCFTDKANDAAPGFYIAFIDAATMEIKNVVNETRADEMSGTAFGELQQDKMFMDENENLYIACGNQIPDTSKSTQQYGRLIRVNKGEYDTDKNYLGFDKYDSGKILTVDYMGNNKVMMYIQDPYYCGLASTPTEYTGWGQNEFNSYYAVYDLATGERTELTFEGKALPYSCGSFTDRVSYYNGKCYIGTCPDEKTGNLPTIYIYDVETGSVTKGATLASGFYFDRLSVVDNVN